MSADDTPRKRHDTNFWLTAVMGFPDETGLPEETAADEEAPEPAPDDSPVQAATLPDREEHMRHFLAHRLQVLRH